MEEHGLTLSIAKGLADRMYEKRKDASLELQAHVKGLVEANKWASISKLISLLQDEFIFGENQNARKGGLISLSAITLAIPISKLAEEELGQYVTPPLSCLLDPEPQVRLAKSDNARLDLQSPAVMLLLRASGDVLWLCFTVYRAYAERVHHPIHPLPNNAAITIRPVPTVPTVAAAVARQHILPFFTEIFDALTKLAADSHTEVQAAGLLLDRLIKDIVTERDAGGIDIASIVPLIAERMFVLNPAVRTMIVSWITLLDSVPELELIQHLPASDPNDSIQAMAVAVFEDFNVGIKAINDGSEIPLVLAVVEILIPLVAAKMLSVGGSGGASGAEVHDSTGAGTGGVNILQKQIAMGWILDIVDIAKAELLPHVPALVAAILPWQSKSKHKEDTKLMELSISANQSLLKLVTEVSSEMLVRERPPVLSVFPMETAPLATHSPARPRARAISEGSGEDTEIAASAATAAVGGGRGKIRGVGGGPAAAAVARTLSSRSQASMPVSFELDAMLAALTATLKARAVKTRISALRWIMALHVKIPEELAAHGSLLVDALLQTLKDKEDRVLLLGLEALSEISSCSQESAPSPRRQEQVETIYLRFISGLVTLLKANQALSGDRGNFTVQQLASLIPPYRLYLQLARAVAEEESVVLARGVIRKLNWILLTAPELKGLREDLRSMKSEASRELFAIVYQSWCPSPIATLSICLLAQMYEHATVLLTEFVNIDFTAVHVAELERLAQLFDLPIFNFARLQVLSPQQHAYLVKSEVYTQLKSRLDSIPGIVSALGMLEPAAQTQKQHAACVQAQKGMGLDSAVLLSQFVEAQKKNRSLRAIEQQWVATGYC
eukprot:gene15456-10433_t